jgi:hypothetical protein
MPLAPMTKEPKRTARNGTPGAVRNEPDNSFGRVYDSLGNHAMQRLSASPRGETPSAVTAVSPGTIQRSCACGGTDPCQCGSKTHVLPWIGRRATDDATGSLPSASVASAALSGQGPGNALDEPSRAFMEPRFGQDLSGVRIHTDTTAARAAKMLSAEAFTVGQHIHFGENQYRPDTPPGRRLLAHELTHTIQQGGAASNGGTVAASSTNVMHPRDPSEREAEGVADRITTGAAVDAAAIEGAPSGIFRQPAPTPSPTRPDAVPEAPSSDDPSSLPRDAAIFNIADAVVIAMDANDVGGVVSRLNSRAVVELKAIRERVYEQKKVWLEEWLIGLKGQSAWQNRSITALAAIVSPELSSLAVPAARGLGLEDPAQGGTAEEALRWLWPALGLVEQLRVYDEGYREIEQAQLDVIRKTSAQERQRAWTKQHDEMLPILANMNAREEYQAREMLDSGVAEMVATAMRILERDDDNDVLFDAILALPPTARTDFVRENYWQIFKATDDERKQALVAVMARPASLGGREVDALIARLQLATEDRPDDMEAVQAVVDRAVALLTERRQLEMARTAAETSSDELARIRERLDELEGLDKLMNMQRDDGKLPANSFLGLVSAARNDQAAFFNDARRLDAFAPSELHAHNYAFQVAKERILLAGSDFEQMRAIILSTTAPPIDTTAKATPQANQLHQWETNVKLREELLDDPQVKDAVGDLKGSEQQMVRGAVKGDEFDAMLYQVGEANGNARWGELFSLMLQIARNPAWRAKYESAKTQPFAALGVDAKIRSPQREIVYEILESGRMPIDSILSFEGILTGGADMVKDALGSLPEEQRARLRRGWALSRNLHSGELTDDDRTALAEYKALADKVRDKFGEQSDDFEAVMATIFGASPTKEEMESGEGRYAAALWMYERLSGREQLDRGLATSFTEKDETMDAAAREYQAMWMPMAERDPKKISLVELAELTALYDRFSHRSDEFKAVNKTIGEMAGMVAATVAGIIVIAATDGAATPAVVAAAAAAGAGARVVTREMFGGAYYEARSEGARDALLGAVDGALAVVSGGLAAKGAELVGFGGKALTLNAARIAGEVAEEASLPFRRKVLASAVESAIDGMFSGSVSEAFGTMTDDGTWRLGILNGLVRVGEAALIGGLTGGLTGGVLGAGMPIVGAGLRKAWQSVAGEGLERTLAKAGQKDALEAARAAAQAGDFSKAYQKAAELEQYLSYEEALALRQELSGTIRSRPGRGPPGTAHPKDPHQQRLLAESGRGEAAPTGEHLNSEHDIVRRSEPQPSAEPGYVDEVDLGNGHSWKRRADGTWCRFTSAKLCGTKISGGPPMTASELARLRAAESQLELAQGASARALEVRDEFTRIRQKYIDITRQPGPRSRFLDLDLLTADEQDILAEATQGTFAEGLIGSKDLRELTLADLQAIADPPEHLVKRSGMAEGFTVKGEGKSARFLSPLEKEVMDTAAAETAAALELEFARVSDYEKLRKISPSSSIRNQVKSRAKSVDEVTGRIPASGEVDTDHIWPLKQLTEDPYFQKLSWREKIEFANYPDNFKAVDRKVNRSRGAKSWNQEFPLRATYSEHDLSNIVRDEARVRAEMLEKMKERVARKAKK